MTEPDFLAQLVEAGARALFAKGRFEGATWESISELDRSDWREDAHAAFSAALSASLTEPCPTCGGRTTDQTDLAVARFNRDGHLTNCPACEGSGRVPSSARLILGEQVGEWTPDQGLVNLGEPWDWDYDDDHELGTPGLPVYRVITKGEQ